MEGSGRPPSSPDARRAPVDSGPSSKRDSFTSSEGATESSVDPATRGFEVVRDAWPWLTRDEPVTPRSLARFLRGLRTGRAPAAWPDLAGFGLFSGLTRRESEHLAAEILDRLRREPPVPSASPVAPPAAVRGGAARALTREELVERRVPRPVGLAILRLVASADGLLVVSGVANVLRGSRGCDALRAYPHLGESELFGALGDRSYEELTTDVLAMHAKGFLRPVSGSRRFGLAESGRQVLAGTRTQAQTPAAAPPA